MPWFSCFQQYTWLKVLRSDSLSAMALICSQVTLATLIRLWTGFSFAASLTEQLQAGLTTNSNDLSLYSNLCWCARLYLGSCVGCYRTPWCLPAALAGPTDGFAAPPLNLWFNYFTNFFIAF
jgi:hypothetical protein